MLRSASFAFLEILRVCGGAHASKFCRAILRIHDVHCGSSDDLVSEAMAEAWSAAMPPKKRGSSSEQIWR
jgi:DNA-directed RNA polymerase specialized sigma24 family protein